MDPLPVTENDQFWQQAADAMAEVDREFQDVGIREGITVRPGETLVLSCHRMLSMQELDNFTEKLKTMIPGINVVVVDDDIHLTVLSSNTTDELRDMVSEMMIDKFRQLARQNGMLPR
jgi:uncharacterized spore protein YtfJ